MVRFTRHRRLRASLTVLAAATIAATPFAPAAQAQQTQDGTVLRVALVQEIDHLNPFTASFASSTMLGRMAFEFMTLPAAEDTMPTGGVADKWETSEDKLTWTFHIRDGMKWSDGQPVTAKDAAFTFNRIMTDEQAAEANGSYVANFDTVTAPDEQTLEIKTKEPQSSMTALDVPIVPEHVWSGIDDMTDPKTDSIDVVGVGSGPFLFSEYRPNEVIKMKANPNYFRGPAQVAEVQFISYENADAAVNALNNGEVDLVNRLTATQFDSLKDKDDIATNKAAGRRYNDLLINPGAQTIDRQPIGDGHPALKDVAVRQAIARSIDPQTIVDKVSGGYGELPGSIVPPVFEDYHWEPSEAEKHSYDPAAANKALDEAGYAKGPNGIRVGPDGKPLSFRITGRTSEDYDVRVADYLVGWLKDIGIEGKKALVSDNEVDEITSAGNYDLALSGYGTNPDPDYILAKHSCSMLPTADGGSATASFFCDEEFDKLYEQQAVELDPAKRIELVKQAQARIYDQAPNIVLSYDNNLEAYRSDKFSSFAKQPADDGPIMEQVGYWGYYGAVPAEGADGEAGGVPTGVWIGVGAAVIVVVAVGGFGLSRRKRAADDEE